MKSIFAACIWLSLATHCHAELITFLDEDSYLTALATWPVTALSTKGLKMTLRGAQYALQSPAVRRPHQASPILV